MKHLLWIVPTVAIVAVGSSFLSRISISFDGGDAEVAQTAPAPMMDAEPDPAIAALAAVTAVTTPEPIAAPENVSQQLAALLIEDEIAVENLADVEVSRSQGLDISAVQETSTQASVALDQTATAPTAPVGTDFFSAAQANLAQANSCANDLRSLAAQSKVYFPSGTLSGEASGLAQARLIGTIAQRCEGVTIQVEGHSDPSGNAAVNLRLSQERADAVIARVAAAGIDTSKMVAIGMGDGFPSGVTGAQPAAYYDRRVEFTIIDTIDTSFGSQPVSNGGIVLARVTACVSTLQQAARSTTVNYSPGSVIVSPQDLDAVLDLADMAQACPEARLRVIGQHAEEYGTVENAATGRLRAIALMTSLVGAGYESTQIIMSAPSGSMPMPGLSNARVDFDVILEEL